MYQNLEFSYSRISVYVLALKYSPVNNKTYSLWHLLSEGQAMVSLSTFSQHIKAAL